MKTEEKTTMTETILLSNQNLKSDIYNLKKFPKNNLKNLKNNFFNKKSTNIFRNENKKEKNKIFETQITTPKKQEKLIVKKKLNVFSRNNGGGGDKKKSLFNEIKSLCDNLYENKKSKNDDSRIKLKEDIIKRIDNFVFSDLKKNILFPKMLNLRSNSRRNFQKFKLFSEEQKNKNKKNDLKRINLERTKDLDKLSMKDILNRYDENYKIKNRNIKVHKYKYDDYAQNDTIYNQPQIHTLNNTYRPKKSLPIIDTKKALNSFKDFSKLIPEKKLNQKENQKQLYKEFKAMKSKNKNEFGIYL